MNKFLKNLKVVAMAFAMLLTANSFAQDREHLRQSIEEWGQCRNVAMTENNGNLALYGMNGCSYEGCPAELVEAITKLHEENKYIDDIQLTENGSWLVLYGDNGVLWSHIPASLEKAIRGYNEANDVINSVSFNDNGDWIIVTDKHYAASDDDIFKWMEEGMKEYGEIWATCVTDEGVIAVFEKGYSCVGEMPEGLSDALDETELDVYRLKICGDSWFFADKEGQYEYDM